MRVKPRSPSIPRLRGVLATLLALVSVTQVGCVRRRMTIRSNPPGALVYVDDQPIGVTPASSAYTYYATRNIRLIKDGYQTQTVKQRFRTPWYQFPLLDFISENLWPVEIRDERTLDVELIPQQIVPNHELVQRGEELRGRSLQGLATPLPNTAPPFSSAEPTLGVPY